MRSSSAVITIDDIVLSGFPTPLLWAAHLDGPRPGAVGDDQDIEIIGWAVGRIAPAVAVELVHGGELCLRVPISLRRSDVAAVHPDVTYAESSGFGMRWAGHGVGPFKVSLRAVLANQARAPFASITGARRWRDLVVPPGVAFVSVIIPCHGAARDLSAVIESVVTQTYPNFEIIVADDGSAGDIAASTARYPGLRHIRLAPSGLSTGDAAIREARGGYLVFLAANDRLRPEALEIGLGQLAEHPECAGVAGRYAMANESGGSVRPLDDREARGDTKRLATSSVVMFQRFAFAALEGFGTCAVDAHRPDAWRRIASSHRIHHHSAIVAEGSSVET
jgi:hypothetical protein